MTESLHAQIESRPEPEPREYRVCPVRRGKPRVDKEICSHCRWQTECPAEE